MARCPDMFADPPTAIERITVSAETAAKMLDVSAPHLRKEARLGRIPHVKIGSRVVFSPQAIREWVATETSKSLGK